MLAPLRDRLCPRDPSSSPLLRITKEIYFTRLSRRVYPGTPEFEEARWITAEDVNIEHLLDVFTTIDGNSESIWDACTNFMDQLYWHKPQLVILGPKIEALPDDHPYKPQCLWDLARLFDKVGNFAERKRLLGHNLELWRWRGDDFAAAQTLKSLSDANRRMGLYGEGIRQAEKASRIFEKFCDVVQRAQCLVTLAWLLCHCGQLNAAEEAGSCVIDLLPEKGEEFLVCQAHHALGEIYQKKGERKKAIHHLEVALGIASSLDRVDQLVWINFSLADVFSKQGEFEDAQTYLEHAKSHAGDNTYVLAYVMYQQAWVWDRQRRFDEARSEALRALNAFEMLGAVNNAEFIRKLLRRIDTRRAAQPS